MNIDFSVDRDGVCELRTYGSVLRIDAADIPKLQHQLRVAAAKLGVAPLVLGDAADLPVHDAVVVAPADDAASVALVAADGRILLRLVARTGTTWPIIDLGTALAQFGRDAQERIDLERQVRDDVATWPAWKIAATRRALDAAVASRDGSGATTKADAP